MLRHRERRGRLLRAPFPYVFPLAFQVQKWTASTVGGYETNQGFYVVWKSCIFCRICYPVKCSWSRLEVEIDAEVEAEVLAECRGCTRGCIWGPILGRIRGCIQRFRVEQMLAQCRASVGSLSSKCWLKVEHTLVLCDAMTMCRTVLALCQAEWCTGSNMFWVSNRCRRNVRKVNP